MFSLTVNIGNSNLTRDEFRFKTSLWASSGTQIRNLNGQRTFQNLASPNDNFCRRQNNTLLYINFGIDDRKTNNYKFDFLLLAFLILGLV